MTSSPSVMFQGIVISIRRASRHPEPTVPPNTRSIVGRSAGICQASRPMVPHNRRTIFCFVVQADRRAGGAVAMASC